MCTANDLKKAALNENIRKALGSIAMPCEAVTFGEVIGQGQHNNGTSYFTIYYINQNSTGAFGRVFRGKYNSEDIAIKTLKSEHHSVV